MEKRIAPNRQLRNKEIPTSGSKHMMFANNFRRWRFIRVALVALQKTKDKRLSIVSERDHKRKHSPYELAFGEMADNSSVRIKLST